MKQTGSARYELTVGGRPRSYRDSKAIAFEAGAYLKSKNPNAEVTVRDPRAAKSKSSSGSYQRALYPLIMAVLATKSRLDSDRPAAILGDMLRIVSPRLMSDKRPPVGAVVRLRYNPVLTGVVTGDCVDLERVCVRWYGNDEITDCLNAGVGPVSARKSPRKTEHRWRIIKLKSAPAADLGTVSAPDERGAIEQAATTTHGIAEHLRYKLVARRIG